MARALPHALTSRQYDRKVRQGHRWAAAQARDAGEYEEFYRLLRTSQYFKTRWNQRLTRGFFSSIVGLSTDLEAL